MRMAVLYLHLSALIQHKTLSGESNPNLATILKVMHALDLKLHPEIACV
jgi:DNA-binding phage protein